MKIKSIYVPKEDLTIVKSTDRVQDVLKRFEETGIFSLPVVKGNDLLGTIYKEKLYRVLADMDNKEAYKNQEIEDSLIIKNERFTTLEAPVELAAKEFVDNQLTFIPVNTEEGDFAGIVTHKAIFKYLVDLFGITEDKIVVYIENMSGQLAKVLDVFTKLNVNIKKIVAEDAKVLNLYRLIIQPEKDLTKVREALKKDGLRVEE
ncbi:CBS domain-containing protein [Isachenkonia alkalipeptolytica]|uniref:CBS domain-containing protein n=1 Tax=Isachenkonia alkalipeptolytica TaxID=2565777 RepID=A0AA43XIH9_9CLOT|nr:CBS domain-containing protein [Isachenkonia alkalipeptolytica]NBG86959.1 CBS domain-containing protein [Isachenkonia alkalipeptolytica]